MVSIAEEAIDQNIFNQINHKVKDINIATALNENLPDPIKITFNSS